MLDVLQTLLPIPTSPFDVDESVMTANQTALGIQFPHDYVTYSRTYGSGTISVGTYSWDVWSACCPSFQIISKQFFKWNAEVREALETSYLPLGLFPEPRGLLPFGTCDNGVWWCWRTNACPNQWAVVDINRYYDGGFEIYEMGFVEFLVKVLTGQVELSGKTFDWDPDNDITFTPLAYRFSPP